MKVLGYVKYNQTKMQNIENQLEYLKLIIQFSEYSLLATDLKLTLKRMIKCKM